MNKVLVITGGSSGIGKATAERFAREGWRVFELSRHGESHGGIVHIYCDVTDPVSSRSAIECVLQHTDHIDVLISNAGCGISGSIEFTPPEEAHRQMDVNFFGALNTVQAVLPQMRKQQYGRIIFTSSVAAEVAIPYQAFYSASKAAINSLAMALLNEVREFGISVSCLMPGDVATGFTAARAKSELGVDVYKHLHHAVANMEHDEQHGMTPEEMASDFWHIANKKYPAPLYVGGASYGLLCFIKRFMPQRFVNWVLNKLYA